MEELYNLYNALTDQHSSRIRTLVMIQGVNGLWGPDTIFDSKSRIVSCYLSRLSISFNPIILYEYSYASLKGGTFIIRLRINIP